MKQQLRCIPWQEKFWLKVYPVGDCWEWMGSRLPNGYGHCVLDGVYFPSYRMAYELAVGPIPLGLEIDHLCRNRACVRPSHLEVVDHRTNILRGDTFAARQAKQTHCLRGHELSGDNLITRKNHRSCKTCRRAQGRMN